MEEKIITYYLQILNAKGSAEKPLNDTFSTSTTVRGDVFQNNYHFKRESTFNITKTSIMPRKNSVNKSV